MDVHRQRRMQNLLGEDSTMYTLRFILCSGIIVVEISVQVAVRSVSVTTKQSQSGTKALDV